MENKYYTPDITEFYPGFEYESSEFGRKIWSQEIFYLDFDNGNELLDIYNEGYQCTNLRVKYLDAEDIESLGFEYKTDFGDSLDNLLFSFVKNGIGLYRLYFNGVKNKVTITHRFSDGQKIFVGKIKNKSELKVLLKQLGIDEK